MLKVVRFFLSLSLLSSNVDAIELECTSYHNESYSHQINLEAHPLNSEKTVIVALIDSGIDFSHPALQGKEWVMPGRDGTHGHNFVDGSDNTVDNHHHGTHLAGIISY